MKKFLPVILSILVVVFGIVFVVSGITTLKNKDLYDSAVNATVVDIQEEWQTVGEDDQLVNVYYIDYEVDGVKYEHVECPESNGDMKVGDTVEILYQSKDPSKISGHNITSSGVIFIAVGAVVALGGCFAIVKKLLRG